MQDRGYGLPRTLLLQRFAVRLNRSAKGTPALTQGVLLGEEHASARSGVNNSASRYRQLELGEHKVEAEPRLLFRKRPF